MAAHAEAEHAHPGDAVFHHEQVGRTREHLELLVIVEPGNGCESLLDGRASILRWNTGERLDRAHREPVRREPAGHVLEERPQPADVGMEHDAGARHAVGASVDRRHVDRVECQRHRLDGDVELTSFAQVTHGGGNLARGSLGPDYE